MNVPSSYKDTPMENLYELASIYLSGVRALDMYYTQSGKKDYTDINELMRLANEVIAEILRRLPSLITPVQNLQGDIAQTLFHLDPQLVKS